MNIVIGIIIIGFVYYCYIKVQGHNEFRSEYQERLKLMISEENKDALRRIEGLIVDLEDRIITEQRTNQELLIHNQKETYKKMQKMEVFLAKDLNDDELNSYIAQDYND